MPICRKCKTNKDDSNFSKKSKGICRQCKTEDSRRRRQAKAAEKEAQRQKLIAEGKLPPDPVIPDGHKQCIKCKTIKLLDEFHKHSSYADGRRSTCMLCANRINRQKAINEPKKEGMHKCIKCKIEKNVNAFYKDKSRPSGLRDWCKDCVKSYNENKYDNIPDTKECNVCFEELSIDSFSKSKYGKYYRSNSCRKCRSKLRRAKENPRRMHGVKLCVRCKNEKDVSDYHRDKTNLDGLQTYCGTCKIELTNIANSKIGGYFKALYRDLISNAYTRGINVSITLDDIINKYYEQDGLCVYSNVKMTMDKIPKKGKRLCNINNVSVDRIDSTKGYTIDNIQIICVGANLIKYDFSEEEFLDMCKKIAENTVRKELYNYIQKIKKIHNVDDEQKKCYQEAYQYIIETTINTVDPKYFEILQKNIY